MGLVNGREAYCHDEIVKVASKNCDKLIAYDPLVSCWAILKLSRLQKLSRHRSILKVTENGTDLS